jgi:hypothetical protein
MINIPPGSVTAASEHSCSIALGVKRILELSDQREEQSYPVQKDRLVETSLEHPFPHNSEHPEYIDNDHWLEWLQ